MFRRNVTNELKHGHGLTHARAAKESHLAALGERADQVDDLDARFQNLVATFLIFIRRRFTVNGQVHLCVHRSLFIDGITEHIHDATQGFLANRNGDRLLGVRYLQPPRQPIRRAHGDGPNDSVSQLLLDFQREPGLRDLQRVVHFRYVFPRELYVYHRADYLYDSTAAHVICLLTVLLPYCASSFFCPLLSLR